VSVAVAQTGRNLARLVVRRAMRVRPGQVVCAATAVSAGAWAAVAVIRESRFLDKRQDLGNYTQAVWNTAHGHFLQVTEAGGLEVSRLGIHVDPIIIAFVPLWRLWPSPLLLLTLQAVAVSLGAIPLFWLGRKHLRREWDAALLAVAYLLSPTITWNVVTDFHSVALAVPLLFFAIWYLDEDRLVAFAATAGGAALCQEQIGLIIGCLGLWYAWQRRRWAAGLAIAAGGFAISAVDFFVVLRHFSGGSPYAARFGGSPGAILRDLFTHPFRLTNHLKAYDLLVLLVALPVIGFCFGSTILLAASPQIALLLLSRRLGDLNWVGLNALVLIPFVYAATAYTLARSAKRTRRNEPNLVAGQVLAASLGVAIIFGPFGINSGQLFRRPHSSVVAQQGALKLVPRDARVSATNHLALPLAGRRYLYVFPVLKKADWAIVDSRDASLPDLSQVHHRTGISVGISDLYWQPKLMRRELRFLKRSPAWLLVYHQRNIYVFKRAPSPLLASPDGGNS
jgi:uncharacterized membrane protein